MRSEIPNIPTRRVSPIAAVLSLLFVAMTIGCVETRVIKQSWPGLRELGDAPRDEDAGERRVRGQAWAVELERFAGPDRLSEAYAFAQDVRTDAQIADVWFINRGDEVIVYSGRYPRRDHPEAKEKLKAVRAASMGKDRPFRRAKLVVIERGVGSVDEYNLAQYSGYFTLLLGTYERDYGSDYRSAAERYAGEVREEHELDVYYYHGPNQSLVTAGLFTQFDFVVVDGRDAYGPNMRSLQELFPSRLHNGKTLRNPELTTEDQLEPTVIVRVP